jgi:hypothetical protein
VYGQTLPPPRSPVSGAELQPNAEWLGGIFSAAQQPDGRLGHDQRDVSLQPISQALAQVRRTVLPRREINPYLTVSNLDGEHACLVSKLVEGSAALEVEAGVMPVAGEDAVLQRAPMQGESHVGTAIVQGVHPTVMEEERQRVAGDTDRGATGATHIVQPGGPHEVI